ncbi:alpha-2-macroglobulin domain-containing protein [Klebsiella oxytoca]|nr:alpha-2-macroglobulin domain-containing protein [Klebsiella oxytoca]
MQDLPGSWQAQTSVQAEPLSGEKAQTRNLTGDQLAALQVTNTGQQPLWLRLDSSGYPQNAPQPGGNVLGIERQVFDTPGSAEIALFAAQRRTGFGEAGGDG